MAQVRTLGLLFGVPVGQSHVVNTAPAGSGVVAVSVVVIPPSVFRIKYSVTPPVSVGEPLMDTALEAAPSRVDLTVSVGAFTTSMRVTPFGPDEQLLSSLLSLMRSSPDTSGSSGRSAQVRNQ